MMEKNSNIAYNCIMNRKYSLTWPLLIPLAGLCLFAPYSSQIDIAISNYFYTPENRQFSSSAFFLWVYDWTVFPAQFVAVSATLVLISSYWHAPWQPFRRIMWLLIIPMAIGAGLITHTLFKDHWGRPRPKQVAIYGGTEPFRAFYDANPSLAIGTHKSFPCGHCTMGFYFFAAAAAARRLNRHTLCLACLFIAIGLGGLLGLARIAQGGHFLSDVLVGAAVLWWTTVVADYLLFERKSAIEPAHTHA